MLLGEELTQACEGDALWQSLKDRRATVILRTACMMIALKFPEEELYLVTPPPKPRSPTLDSFSYMLLYA